MPGLELGGLVGASTGSRRLEFPFDYRTEKDIWDFAVGLSCQWATRLGRAVWLRLGLDASFVFSSDAGPVVQLTPRISLEYAVPSPGIQLGWFVGAGPVIEPYRAGNYQDKDYTAWDIAVMAFAGLAVGR